MLPYLRLQRWAAHFWCPSTHKLPGSYILACRPYAIESPVQVSGLQGDAEQRGASTEDALFIGAGIPLNEGTTLASTESAASWQHLYEGLQAGCVGCSASARIGATEWGTTLQPALHCSFWSSLCHWQQESWPESQAI